MLEWYYTRSWVHNYICEKYMSGWRGYKLKFIVLIVVILIFPYIIDRLLAMGVLKNIPHYFSADVWFAFIGSYLPGMLLGSITIIQTFIIQENNKKIQELTYKQRFSVLEPILIERISSDSDNYPELIGKVQSVFGARVGASIGEDKYYLLSFELRNSSVYDLKQIQLKCINWFINGQLLPSIREEKYICNSAKGNKHTLEVYALFAYPDNANGIKANQLIAQFSNNYGRGDLRFEQSSFTMVLLISDEIKENQELNINLDLKYTKDPNVIKGVSSYAYME